ncbi:MAG TPA: O-antigen ligase family protein [Candidatus Sulfotelmatobacter sp.]|nr:O-antigen ligase family protein [Candidatus Sulfotelmatobacter sp.]
MTPTPTPDSARQQKAAQLGSVVLYGTFGLLLFGPLAFGAVEPWSIFMVEAGSIALTLIWLAKEWIEGEINIRWNPLFLPMAAFGLLILLQIVFPISAYRHDTISDGLLFCAYGILCFLASQSLVKTSHARKLALIFCIYGAVLASFSLIQGISSNGKLYWVRAPHLGGWIYGPYVNHNHYAGLMEMLVPIPLVLSLTHLAYQKTRIAAAAAAAVMGGTIFLSGSRGGMLAITAEVVVLGIVLIKQKHDLRTALSIGVFVLIAAALLTGVGGDQLSRRLSTVQTGHSDLTNDMRFQINRDGLHMFAKRPILGWGLGAFPIVYPQFRTFYTNFFVNQAHNDYLQLLVETGAVGFGLMLWFVVVLYRRAIKKIGKWTSEVSGALSLACILGCTGILVHSALDFNLEIPANAALFYVFCTLGAASPLMQPVRKRRPVPAPTEELLPAPASEAS